MGNSSARTNSARLGSSSLHAHSVKPLPHSDAACGGGLRRRGGSAASADGAAEQPVSTAGIRAPRRAWRLRETHIGGLTPAAWLFWAAGVVPAASGIVVAAYHVHGVDWRRFATLALLASLSQLLFSFHLNRRRVFHPAIVFIVAGALLLPPELMILLVVITCVPDWFKQRYKWYARRRFNITANYVLSGLAAWAVGGRNTRFPSGFRP